MRLNEDKSGGQRHTVAMTVLRLLMVDDHLMLTEALSAHLATCPDLRVVGRCGTSDPGVTEVVERLRPDVITLEVQPAGSGTGELLGRLATAWPGAHVVVLTGEHDEGRAVEAARAGAVAWVPKERGADELATVLRGAVRGHSWFPPELLGAVLRELRGDVRRARDRKGPLDVLSERERDVLLGMVEGKGGPEIADELLISTDTVRTHARSILSKLRVHSRLEAVRVARAAGLRASDQPDDQARDRVLLPFDRHYRDRELP